MLGGAVAKQKTVSIFLNVYYINELYTYVCA